LASLIPQSVDPPYFYIANRYKYLYLLQIGGYQTG